jgi:predicted metal-dependent hydrolase
MNHTVNKANIAAEIRTTTQECGVFSYGEEIIHYDIVRKAAVDESKKTQSARKIVIKVHPNQRVVATVPDDASKEAIQQAIIKRARWVWASIQEFATHQEFVLPKNYVSGETQFYLGRRYVLKVQTEIDEKSSTVKLLRGKLKVTLKKENEDKSKQVKALVDQWYLEHAKQVFYDRLHAMLIKATWVKDVPPFKIMVMKKQWGSCSTKGTLMLNPHLVKAPKECIDYVILHELCHIAEHNHGEKFWRLLTQVMPNWKEVKAKLDDMAELYLND